MAWLLRFRQIRIKQLQNNISRSKAWSSFAYVYFEDEPGAEIGGKVVDAGPGETQRSLALPALQEGSTILAIIIAGEFPICVAFSPPLALFTFTIPSSSANDPVTDRPANLIDTFHQTTKSLPIMQI
jgi:hypothetical protein